MKELCFKQWTADDLSFNQQKKLFFSDCDKNLKMSWSEILRFTSDGAGEAFTMRDMSWKMLQNAGIVFVVSRVSFHVIKMPVADQLITLHTWEEASQGPLFSRRYQILDTLTQEILITGFSLWTVLDVKTHRIIPAKAYTLSELSTRTSEYDGIKPGKIPVPENLQSFGNHKVVFSDMDGNGHVNNSKYINFAIDNLPAEYQDKTFTDMRLNYSKEAMYGETIELFGNIDEEKHKITVIGKVLGNVSFETELYW